MKLTKEGLFPSYRSSRKLKLFPLTPAGLTRQGQRLQIRIEGKLKPASFGGVRYGHRSPTTPAETQPQQSDPKLSD